MSGAAPRPKNCGRPHPQEYCTCEACHDSRGAAPSPRPMTQAEAKAEAFRRFGAGVFVLRRATKRAFRRDKWGLFPEEKAFTVWRVYALGESGMDRSGRMLLGAGNSWEAALADAERRKP